MGVSIACLGHRLFPMYRNQLASALNTKQGLMPTAGVRQPLRSRDESNPEYTVNRSFLSDFLHFCPLELFFDARSVAVSV